MLAQKQPGGTRLAIAGQKSLCSRPCVDRPARHVYVPRANCSSSCGSWPTAAEQQQASQPHVESGWPSSTTVFSTLRAACAAAVLRSAYRMQSGIHKAACWVAEQQALIQIQGAPQLLAQPGHRQLLAAALLVPTLPGGGFADLLQNRVFMAGFMGWAVAQCLKIFTRYAKTGKWDLRALVDSGGMPSSHSSLCAGITTAIALQHGFGSTAFAVAVAFSSIVMYDAAGVRRHAGKQAEVLNQVIGELLEGHPVSAVKLKEVLGHTPLQVCAGAVLGILFGLFYPMPIPVDAALAAPIVA